MVTVYLFLYLVGRDFNIIREEDDKNCDNYNHNLMDIFNEFIGSYQLRELKRSGLRYTWTNKQNIPILVNLDRVMFSSGWEERFPLSVSWGLTKIGSDHVPIVVDNGESLQARPRYFFFEQQWTQTPDFYQLVLRKWQEAEDRCPEKCYSLDCWHWCLAPF